MMSHQFLSLINQIAVYFPVFLLVFTFRGFFKSLAATLMGDDTSQQEGFLTLNPLAHVDVLGLMITLFVFFFLGWLLSATLPRGMLVLILLAFGVRWTIPVPVDDNKFRHYTLGGITTSLARPIGNFILAFTTLIIAKFLVFEGLPRYVFVTLIEFLKSLIDIALWFGVLDLIPIPPFDGGQILKYIIPHSKQYIFTWLEEYSLFIILFLFFMPGISDFFWEGLHAINSVFKKFMFELLF